MLRFSQTNLRLGLLTKIEAAQTIGYPAGGIPGSRGAGERGAVASGYNFSEGTVQGFRKQRHRGWWILQGTHTREKEERGDTCFGVAKIQGYVNFACYKTGGH